MAKEKKISLSFWVVLALILSLFISVWFYWKNIETFFLGDSYYPVVSTSVGPVVDQGLKKDVLSALKDFKQYGQWPISAVRGSQDRGNPFEEKK